MISLGCRNLSSYCSVNCSVLRSWHLLPPIVVKTLSRPVLVFAYAWHVLRDCNSNQVFCCLRAIDYFASVNWSWQVLHFHRSYGNHSCKMQRICFFLFLAFLCILWLIAVPDFLFCRCCSSYPTYCSHLSFEVPSLDKVKTHVTLSSTGMKWDLILPFKYSGCANCHIFVYYEIGVHYIPYTLDLMLHLPFGRFSCMYKYS